MKRILLTSTALIAVAGSAFAAGHAVDHGVSFGGDAELKYNSETDFTYGVGLTVSASTALDNGITASLAGDIDITDDVAANDNTFGGQDVSVSDIVFALSSDTATLTFGDTATAANSNWVSAGDMEQDGFYEANDGAGEDATLRGDVTAGAMKASVSYGLYDDDLDALQVFASYNFGSGTVGFAMEDDNRTQNETRGIFVTSSFGGADVTLAYAETGDENSTGVKVSYPVGDVTVGAYYVSESMGDDNYGVDVAYASGPLSLAAYYKDKQGDDNYGVDMDYDMGNGLTFKAGVDMGDGSDDDGYYVGAAYDLGGGATVSLVHTDAENTNADNEYFSDDDNLGTTLKLSLSF